MNHFSRLLPSIVVAGLFFVQPVKAERPQIEHVNIATPNQQTAVLRLRGKKLPGFQIYSLGDEHQYAIDLPGIQVDRLPTPNLPNGILLHDVVFEQRRGRHLQNPRALLKFNGPVDYSIRSVAGGIEFTFTALASPAALKAEKKRRALLKKSAESALLAEQELIMNEQAKARQALNQLKAEIKKTANLLEDHRTKLKKEQQLSETTLKRLHEQVAQQRSRHEDLLQATQAKRNEMLSLLKQTRTLREAHEQQKNVNRHEDAARRQDVQMLENLLDRKSIELRKLSEKSDKASNKLLTLNGDLLEAQEHLSRIQHQAETLKGQVSETSNQETKRRETLTREIKQLIRQKKTEEISLLALTQRTQETQKKLHGLESEQKELEFLLDEKKRLEQEHLKQTLAHEALTKAVEQARKEKEALAQERRAAVLEQEELLTQKEKELKSLQVTQMKVRQELKRQKTLQANFLRKSTKEKEEIINAQKEQLREEAHAINLLQAQRLQIQTELELARNEQETLKAESIEDQNKMLAQKRRLLQQEEAALGRLKAERVQIEAELQEQKALQTQAQKRAQAKLETMQQAHQNDLDALVSKKERLKKQIAQNQDRALAQAEQAKVRRSQLEQLAKKKKKLTQEIEEQQITAEKEAEKRLLHDENFKKMQAQLNHLVQNKHLLQKELFELRNQKREVLKAASDRPSTAKAHGHLLLSQPDNGPLPAAIAMKHKYWQVPVEKKAPGRFGGLRDSDIDEPGRHTLNRLMIVKNKGRASSVGMQIEGDAKYSVERLGPTTYRVNLLDTRAGNLKVRRILDASDVDASVIRLLPHVEEDLRHRISLQIELRKPARLQTDQDGSHLWFRFSQEGS